MQGLQLLSYIKMFPTESNIKKKKKKKTEIKQSVNPLQPNLQVSNFQRCGRESPQRQA